MAAPTPTARPTPAGVKLDDGYQTLITIASNTDISFWEKTITPPGVDGGDLIETTTMHNSAWRTFAVRSLKTMTEMTTTAAYDPDLYDDILTALNVPTVITVTFPDASTLAFHGALRVFSPDELSEGSQPECSITIAALNQDTDGNEQAPVMAQTYGT